MAGARQLRTIGDLSALSAQPLTRQRLRRAAAMGMAGIGATNPGWTPPASVDSETQDAALGLQNYLDTLPGTPSEHAYDAEVSAFQATWNEDPTVQANPASALDVDGAYGPNTQAALNFVTGLAQPVNTGPAPVPSGGGGAPPLVMPAANTQGSPLGVVLLVGAVGFAAWMFLFRKKKRGAATVEIKSNGRKGGGARRSALLAMA